MTDFTLLPNLQTAIAGRAQAPSNEDSLRREVALNIAIKANGSIVSDSPTYRMSADILSAGDITGIDPSMISRVEPSPGAKGVEPNYFPYVEFVDADFPWRYTLDTQQNSRIIPWVSLIAVTAEEFRHMERGNAPLARIEITNPSKSLPKTSQLWATAHVQVNRNTNNSSSLEDLVNNEASAHFSRLLCPRKLNDSTSYYLFLVPVYESGRLSGLGKSQNDISDWNAYAWSSTSNAPIELPVYKQWRFTTSSMEDFESLARRLSPNLLDEDDNVGGTRSTYIGEPGYYHDQQDASATVEIEGALQKPNFSRDKSIIENTYLSDPLQDTLNAVLQSTAESGLENDGPKQEDPLVALPVYGRHYTDTHEVKADASSKKWFHEANLDLRMRTGSGVGSRITQRHQEDFMQQCWTQVGEITEANNLRARLQTAEKIGESLVEKHIKTLSDDQAIAICQPVFDVIPYLHEGISISEKLQTAGVPSGSYGRSMRRVAAKRTGRNAIADGDHVARTTPKITIPGATVSTKSSRSKTKNSTIKKQSISKTTSSQLKVSRQTKAIEANQKISDLSFMSEELVQSLAGSTVTKPQLSVANFNIDTVINTAVSLIEAIPSRIASDLISGASEEDSENLDPIITGPRIPDAMANYMTEEDPNYLLPNASSLPDNTVSLTEENKAFIEAVMLGANHEMNRELRWREFPTDMRATVLPRFWDSPAPVDNKDNDDIQDIHDWSKKLGQNFKEDTKNRLVLVIRGEIIRRYPDILIAANQQTIRRSRAWRSNRGTTWYPIFSGKLNNQTAYYGFDLTADDVTAAIDEFFFVLMEPPGRFRFGLDIGTAKVRQTQKLQQKIKTTSITSNKPENWDDLSWNHVDLHDSSYINFDKAIQPEDETLDEWGDDSHSASLAKATFQKPVQVVVRASKIISI